MENKKGVTFWLTGVPSSGKSTLAKLVSIELSLVHLDSDKLREVILPQTGYSERDRLLIYNCIISLCKILNENGHHVIVSSVTNLRKYRLSAQNIINEYREIYIKCPVRICEKRDIKKLYYLSKTGKIAGLPFKIIGENDSYVNMNYNCVGIYEPPESPQLVIDTSQLNIQLCIDVLCDYIIKEISGF